MRDRLRSVFAGQSQLLHTVEATLIALFFVQALRFLIGTLYAHIASASLQPALNPALIDPTLPGLIEPSTLTNELFFLVYVMILPALTIFLGRFQVLMLASIAIVAVGRYLMVSSGDISSAITSALVIGGGLMFIAMIVRHRMRVLPMMFIFGLALDQLFRAAGNTFDPSWESDYANTQLILSIIVILLGIYNYISTLRRSVSEETGQNTSGLLTVWGGFAFGSILFVQLSLLSLPNAIAGRADTIYSLMTPLLAIATLLPAVPWVRGRARHFISLFDSNLRGWAWMLFVMLLIILGTRITGVVAGVMFVLAQFLTGLLWWWFARPKAQKERSLGGLWLIFGMIVFLLLTVFDVFTYEYAFVRDFAPEYEAINSIIPPLLRGFRGLGLAVILLAVFIAALPMVQTRRRIAWVGGNIGQSFLMLLVVAGLGVGTWTLARPPVVQGVSQPETIRVATYNIHAGYNEFYHYDLEAIAQTIRLSGANVVLLQEVEAGRLSSFGVDQPLWLARRLGMDARFYPTNEGLQGLAVLSNIEIVFDDGNLLESVGSQTGLQRVQIRPDAGVITVYNTWLDPLLDTGGNQAIVNLEDSQQNQLSQIFGIIRAHHPPDGVLGRTIIGGTFNNLPDSDLISRMRQSGFEDFFADDPLNRYLTFVRTEVQARLDYLWTTQNLRVIGRNVIDSNASDHRLAVIEIILQ